MPSKILNFSSDRLITGINIIDNTLFFTDNENEPKKILLKEFREADHSTGTTNIYGSGRAFQERDITVIRPHPMAAPSISTASGLYDRIDNYINPEAGKPQVITKGSNAHESGAVIYGQSISNGTAFQERGFYYVEYSGDITRNYLLEEGTKVEVNYLDGINFKAELDGLNDGKKHYFIAYAKTAINEVIFADNIKSFISGGAVGAAATVTTFKPQRTDENLKYFLEGEVISNTPVQESGFWYRQTELLEGLSLTDLENDEYRKTIPSDFFDAGSGEFHALLPVEPEKTLFAQAWARNDSGLAKGTVESIFSIRDARGPSVSNSLYYPKETSVEVSGIVTNSNGDLKSRGFYFSKYFTDKITILNNKDTSYVYKVTVPFDEFTENEVFKYNTATDVNFPFTLSTGDNLAFLAFADNGAENQATSPTIVPFESNQSGETTGEPPKVSTAGLVTQPDGKIRVNWTLHNFVDTSGVILVKNKNGNSDEFLGLTAAEKLEQAIQRAAINNNAAILEGEVYRGTMLFTQTPKEPGGYSIVIGSSDLITLEDDKKYYAVAYATKGSRIGYGAVLGPRGTIVDNRGFKLTTLNASNITTTGAKLYGKFEFDGAHDDAIVEAGFVWAKGSPDGIFAQDNTIQVSSGLLAKLDKYAEYNGDEDAASPTVITNEFNASITVTAQEKNASYYFIAYIKTTSGGPKIFADFTQDISSNGNGIIEVTIPGTEDLPLPKPVIREIETDRIQPTLEVKKGNQGGVSDMDFYSLSPTVYYMLEELIPSASLTTDDAIRGYISQNFNSTADDESGKLSFLSDLQTTGSYLDQRATITFGETYNNAIHSQENPELKANATYRAFATMKNGASTGNETFGIFVGSSYDGVGVSNSIEFTTGMNRNNAPDTTPKNSNPVYSSPIVGSVIVDNVKTDRATLRAAVINDGGTSINSRKFYYWQTENSNVTVAQVLANGSEFTNVTASYPMTGELKDLDTGSTYHVVAQATNSAGTGTSENVTKFKTSGVVITDEGSQTEPPTLGTPEHYVSLGIELNKHDIYFDAEGNLREQSGNTENYIRVSTTPDGAEFGYRIGEFNYGANDEINISKGKDDINRDIITVGVPENETGKARKAIVTVWLKQANAFEESFTIHQDAGSSTSTEGPDTGGGSNDLPASTPLTIPGQDNTNTLPGFQSAPGFGG